MAYMYDGLRLTHLTQFEASLFRRWYDDTNKDGDIYEFDVNLWRPVGAAAKLPPVYADNARKLSALRIDCIRIDVFGVNIIEFRQNAKYPVVGTLLTYAALYKLHYPGVRVASMSVVSNQYDPVVEFVCRQIGVQFLVY